MIISRTPLCLSFLGGGSDLPAHYRRHGGAVLSTTIEHSIYVTACRKFDDAVRVSYSHIEEVAHASQIVHPVVRESLALLGIESGIEITSVADIPARGTGLGSSSSFTVGLLNALHAYCGRHVNASRLAEEGCRIEIDRCGEPIGKHDQYAAAYGGLNFIRFYPDETVEVKKLICPQRLVTELQARLLFFYTGIARSGSGLLQQQSEAISACQSTSAAIAEMARLAEAAYADLCNGNIEELGRMLHAAWQVKRQLTQFITNGVIDNAYQIAMNAGAEGGKLLGAGGGGFLMFFAPPDRHAAIRAALHPMRETPLRFAPQGSSIIFVH
jgi:D-glycero-alpha-D-manno-heptose-7-phosphate kinase